MGKKQATNPPYPPKPKAGKHPFSQHLDNQPISPSNTQTRCQEAKHYWQTKRAK